MRTHIYFTNLYTIQIIGHDVSYDVIRWLSSHRLGGLQYIAACYRLYAGWKYKGLVSVIKYPDHNVDAIFEIYNVYNQDIHLRHTNAQKIVTYIRVP
jgi:hypothetical protein